MTERLDIEKLKERLQACADDPIWADHVEMNKATLSIVIAALAQLQAENAELKRQLGIV